MGDWNNRQPKRDARRFEPPPWERERFEALQKERDEQARRDAEEHAAQERSAAEARPAEGELNDTGEQAVPSADGGSEQARDAQAPSAESKKASSGEMPVSQEQLDAMLMQLRTEEPRVDEHLRTLEFFAAGVGGFVGLCLTAWGLIGLRRATVPMAILGASFLVFMGLAFVGMAVWLAVRAINRQGESK